MSKHFSGKERAFVDELARDTGHDLAHWMSEITTRDLMHRNDIIDWLRQQGFTFARASWLERIHHNGGRLIYADVAEPSMAAGGRRKALAAVGRSQLAGHLPAARAARLPASDQDIDTLLLAAKAYRPLAQALMRDILAAVPGADARALNGLIVFSHDTPFAALAPSARDVRLYLLVSDAATSGPAAAASTSWHTSKPPAGLDTLAELTHMLLVTDARQLTRDLRDLVIASSRESG